MQQRDGVAEARLEARDGLRRQRDLGHQHDHAPPALERPLRGPQVDLGLARAGDAVQEVLAARLDRRAAPPPARRSARPRGRRGGGSAAAPPARSAIVTSPRFSSRRRSRGRRPPGPAAARAARAGASVSRSPSSARRRPRAHSRSRGLPARRQHERQRPRRRRAVLLRHPQRELDEVGADRLLAHRARRHQPLRRHLAVRASPTTTPSSFWWPNGTRTTEPTSTRRVGQRVVERPAQAARGGQRLDPGDHAADPISLPVVNRILLGDNLDLMRAEPDGSVQLVYIDPPFNTGRDQRGARSSPPPRRGGGDRTGFGGRRYRPSCSSSPPTATLRRLPRLPRAAAARDAPAAAPQRHALLPHRLPRGALLQAAARRAVRPRVLPQRADLGLRLRRQAAPPLAGQARHDPRLRRTRAPTTSTPRRSTASRTWRPGLVTPEKAARGKLPTDVWWHTIVSPTGREKTGYPTQKPEGVLRRMVQASRPGDLCLDPFAGSARSARSPPARPPLPADGLQPGGGHGCDPSTARDLTSRSTLGFHVHPWYRKDRFRLAARHAGGRRRSSAAS